ncbi:glutamate racemase, partial [Escherichia coli]|nr:glutamate racemase [Escherichia coli]
EEIEHRFFTTGSTQIFKDIAKDWLNMPDMTVEHIKLGK